MQIAVANNTYEFCPWRVRDGKVFHGVFAFDTETTAIDEDRSWLAPAYVLGGAFDGKVGYFIPRDRVGEFLMAHTDVPMVLHNAAFDLDVLEVVAPGAEVYDRVERNQVFDTQLLHRLLTLGVDGNTAAGKGESTLDRCCELYLGLSLEKDVTDMDGHGVRLSYGRWLNRPLSEIETPYLEYLAKDAVVTFRLFKVLRHRLVELLRSSHRTWGYVSDEWLQLQVERWGWQTHHIQLRASIVLKAITANGLTLDSSMRQLLAKKLEGELERLRMVLMEYGYLPGQPGCTKALQAILRQIEMDHPETRLPRTATDKYSAAHDALADLAGTVPFLKSLFEFLEVEKLLSCFVGKMQKDVIHPSFNVLARTGRTTSYGELNAQNLPRNDDVRGCFVPSPGHVFIKADYATIEMGTLGQALLTQFKLQSQMAAAINAGKDLHRLVAAQVTGKPEGQISDDERQKAKPINFGKPGAMGHNALKQYARVSYGVALTDEDVEALSVAWNALFPEMAEYLKPDTDLGEEVARLFGLTPLAHFEHTGNRKFLDHPENQGRPDQPHPILGGMFLKTLKAPNPLKQDGNPYAPADIDFFWNRAEARLDIIPGKHEAAVRNREPSPGLQKVVMSLVGRAPVFTLTGRLRAGATFAARRNTIFQGLASDGAKIALWKLWRAGYRIVNFIHDEVLVEVPGNSDLRVHAEKIRGLMIDGMKEVVPDVRVGVEYAACARWYKRAKPVTAPDGKGLALWQPLGKC